jgi:hypothetical protein
MNNIELRVGPSRLKVDSKEISAQSLNYSIKDIKNFGKRNASFSKPISILQTANTDRIFKSLFNINSSGGYAVGEKVYAELSEDGIVIMKGSLQIDEITEETYEITIATDNLSLYGLLGDKLIKGNLDSSDDISFGSTAYAHNWTRDRVRSWMKSDLDASKNGEGYAYAFVAWDQKFKWPKFNLSNYEMGAYTLLDDYPVFPHLAVRQVFDKILADNGYSYEASSEIEEVLNELYFVYNGDWNEFTTDASLYGKYYLGNPTAFSYSTTTVQLTPVPYSSWISTEVQPIYSIKGWTFQDSYLPGTANDVTGGFDDIFRYPSNKKVGSTDLLDLFKNQRFPLPHGGSFLIDVSMYLFNSSGSAAGTTEWKLSTWSYADGMKEYPIADELTIPASSGAYLNGQVAITVSEKSWYYIHRSTSSSALINLIFGPWSFVKLWELNSLVGAKAAIDLDDLLPRSYKQKDLLDDIFRMFNAFVTVDEIDEKKLIIKTYDDFYSTGIYRDWSTKISEPKTKIIKNSFAKTTAFKFTDDSDIYTQDYKAKFPDGIYTEYVLNDTEFGDADNAIVLSLSPPLSVAVTDSESGFSLWRPPTGGINVLTISDDKQFKTSWKPRMAFINTIDISSMPYGSDRDTIDCSINKWHTLSPRRDPSVGAGDNRFFGWNAENTYLNIPTEVNETLYNRYYKKDILENLGDDARLLTCKAFLNANDIGETNFDDKIYISHSKIGSGYYYINAIKNYTPGGGLCDLELLKFPPVDSSYSSTIDTNVIYRSVFGESASASSGSGGGSTGGGGTSSSDLQAVTTTGNITNQGIVFQNLGTPASQVEINVDTEDNITIDGGLEVNESINITHDVSIRDNLYVSDDANIYGNLEVEGNITGKDYIYIEGQGTFLGDLKTSSDFTVLGDASLYGEVKIDDQYALSTPFVSGFTGTGYQIVKDNIGNYRMELDDLLIRGKFTAYEMILHKIRALNGNLWVSSAVESTWPGESSTYIPAGLYWDAAGDVSTERYRWYFYVDSNVNTLVQGDAIRSQQFLGNNIHQLDWWVTDSSGTKIWVEDQAKDRNDKLGVEDTMSLINGDFTSFTPNAYHGWDLGWDNGDYIKTGLFEVASAGRVSMRIGFATGSGSLLMAIYDSSNNQISTTATWTWNGGSTQDFNFFVTEEEEFLGDTSCYIKLTGVNNSGYASYFGIDILEDHTIPQALGMDVTNFTFVRRGNPDDSNRQGALYLTADDENAPYLEVLDEMEGHNIAPSNRKARLGNLEGLSYNGLPIGGYGLWTQNCYLSGSIISYDGIIGGWTISNNFLYSKTDYGSIYLNANDPYISLADQNDIERIKLTTGPLTRPEQLIGAGSQLWLDASCNNALFYVDVSTSASSGTINKWIEKSGSLVYDYTSDQGDSYHFDLTDDKQYSFEYHLDASVVRINPKPYYNFNWGEWYIQITLNVYNNSDSVIWTETKNLSGYNVGKYPISFAGDLGVVDDAVYFKITYSLHNGMWYANGAVGDEYRGTYRFYFDTTEIKLQGADGKTEISTQGISTAWDIDQYFVIDGSVSNTLDDPFIESAGAWAHKGPFEVDGGVRSNIYIIDTSSGTAALYLDETYEMIVLERTSGYDLEVRVPNDAPVGKKYMFVNATTTLDIDIYAETTGGQIMRGGGNSSVSYGTNAFSDSTPYSLQHMRTMTIIKIQDNGTGSGSDWAWQVY